MSVPFATSNKPRFPRAAALMAAKELCDLMKPHCADLKVCGSLRRKRPTVGDVEIVYIPKFKPRVELRQAEFGAPAAPSEQINLTDELLLALVQSGMLKFRPTAAVAQVWGEKNKFAVHVASGIPIDLFSATPENWWNYVVCRTGGSETNVRISEAARRRKLAWHPYKQGFTDRRGRWLKVRSEKAVFAIAGLPWLEPWER